MKWPKDRKRAFLWAAEAFGTPYEKRTERQRELTSDGICYAIKKLTDSKEIYSWACDFGDSIRAWWWPVRDEIYWTPSCDNERSDLCYLMAVLSKKEFEELQA